MRLDRGKRSKRGILARPPARPPVRRPDAPLEVIHSEYLFADVPRRRRLPRSEPSRTSDRGGQAGERRRAEPAERRAQSRL